MHTPKASPVLHPPTKKIHTSAPWKMICVPELTLSGNRWDDKGALIVVSMWKGASLNSSSGNVGSLISKSRSSIYPNPWPTFRRWPHAASARPCLRRFLEPRYPDSRVAPNKELITARQPTAHLLLRTPEMASTATAFAPPLTPTILFCKRCQ